MDDLDRVLEEVERLDREATPGPWRHGRESRPCVNPWFEQHCDGDMPAEPIESRGTQFALGVAVGCTDRRSDATFIALSRTAAPLLAAEVRRLRAGGCARDQRMTQFCAEAVAKDVEIARLRADLAFADQQGAEAIERVSAAIVADKWNATAAFQDRAIKAETENARLGVLLTASVNETARMQTERDELRALWTAEQQAHQQTARECGDARQDAQALRAELEETRLTLAAEQGRQEGAPSNLWQWDHYRRRWERFEACGITGLVSECGGRAEHGWSIETRGQRLDRQPTARAAMLAADAAAG